MSAGLSCVLILWIDGIPLCTSCCMNRYFRSMCFAFLDDPILVAMLFPLVLSVCMRMFTFVVVASFMKLAMCRPSCAPVPVAYSSDSADDSALPLLVFCCRIVRRIPSLSRWIRLLIFLCLGILPSPHRRRCSGRWVPLFVVCVCWSNDHLVLLCST